jgi:hypothetical protein
VVAQPALPLRFWWYTDADHKSLGLAPDDIAQAARSTAKIFGLRFQTDCIAHPDKINTLRERFPDRFRFDGAIEYRMDGKAAKAHSTLIGSWRATGEAGQPSRDAREKVRDFLRKELTEFTPQDRTQLPTLGFRESTLSRKLISQYPRSLITAYGPFLTFLVEAVKHSTPGAA